MDQLNIDIENHSAIYSEMLPWLDSHFGTSLWQAKPLGMTTKQYLEQLEQEEQERQRKEELDRKMKELEEERKAKELEDEQKAQSTEVGDIEIQDVDITPKGPAQQENFSPSQVEDLVAAVAGPAQEGNKAEEHAESGAEEPPKKKPKLSWMQTLQIERQ